MLCDRGNKCRGCSWTVYSYGTTSNHLRPLPLNITDGFIIIIGSGRHQRCGRICGGSRWRSFVCPRGSRPACFYASAITLTQDIALCLCASPLRVHASDCCSSSGAAAVGISCQTCHRLAAWRCFQLPASSLPSAAPYRHLSCRNSARNNSLGFSFHLTALRGAASSLATSRTTAAPSSIKAPAVWLLGSSITSGRPPSKQCKFQPAFRERVRFDSASPAP